MKRIAPWYWMLNIWLSAAPRNVREYARKEIALLFSVNREPSIRFSAKGDFCCLTANAVKAHTCPSIVLYDRVKLAAV